MFIPVLYPPLENSTTRTAILCKLPYFSYYLVLEWFSTNFHLHVALYKSQFDFDSDFVRKQISASQDPHCLLCWGQLWPMFHQIEKICGNLTLKKNIHFCFILQKRWGSLKLRYWINYILFKICNVHIFEKLSVFKQICSWYAKASSKQSRSYKDKVSYFLVIFFQISIFEILNI